MKVSVGMDANAAIGVVQRRGLNMLRHVDLHVLCIQEQQARRLLALRKGPGPRSPSDMMTRNVDQAPIDLYLGLLNLRFGTGRADIVQCFHSMGDRMDKPAAKLISSHTDIQSRNIDLLKVLGSGPRNSGKLQSTLTTTRMRIERKS